MRKIERSAFLYLEGRDDTFAQCGSCVFGTDRCAIMDEAAVDPKDGSCNFYIKGPVTRGRHIAKLNRQQIGYEVRPVRCENCRFFSNGQWCGLYIDLNGKFPMRFNLDEKVSRYGCCNANTPVK